MMGRRDLTIYVLLAIVGLGGTASVGGLVSTPSAFTPFLIWGGIVALALAAGGLLRMHRNAPKAGNDAAPTGREYLPLEITPKVLIEKTKGRTSLQVGAISRTYVGKWMRHEGPISDVSPLAGGGRIMLHFDGYPDDEDNSGVVSVVFERRWQEQLMALNKGDWLTVDGKLDSMHHRVVLEAAEIVHIGKSSAHPKPNPRKRVTKRAG